MKMRESADFWAVYVSACLMAGFLFTGCATSYDRLRTQATDPPAAGMAVIDPAGVLSEPLGPVVEDVLAWWCFRYPEQCGEIRAYVGRGSIIVAAQDKPLTDPWYPQVGPAWGFTTDNVCRVWWNTRTRGDSFERTLRHELAHVAITALNYSKANIAIKDHHAYMRQVAYPWAD
jgi:hypothetical protein